MYEYYARQNVRPTYANFADDAILAKYAEMRRGLFHRLSLPTSVFAGKSVLEFGPDTGENALVFAKWGAKLTLVEPAVAAHPYISEYFAKFGMQSSIEAISAEPLLGFESSESYDIIDAEGFIYTIQPSAAWIEKTHGLLADNGLLIISYLELYGSFFELLLKAIYNRVCQDPAQPGGLATAKLLFQNKWDSIPHTRRFESWFMDVIQNPFVRQQYFLESKVLLTDMQAGGFRLFSSWPTYRDLLDMSWIKAQQTESSELQASLTFIQQSRLSHLLGRKCFLAQADQRLEDALAELVNMTDKLAENYSSEKCCNAAALIDNIQILLKTTQLVTENEGQAVPGNILHMVKSVFDLLQGDSVEPLINFCCNDAAFISTWGAPNHYAIFQKMT